LNFFKGALRDPLVVDLSGTGFNLTSRADSTTYYSWDGTQFANNTSWIGQGTGFLAIDSNSDGQIESSELFGSSSESGFQALASLDSNHDGVIDASDAAFGSLVVWQDTNGDGIVEAGELETFTELGITSISLSAANGTSYVGDNTIVATSQVTFVNGTHTQIGEAELDVSSTYTQCTGDQAISSDAAALCKISLLHRIGDGVFADGVAVS